MENYKNNQGQYNNSGSSYTGAPYNFVPFYGKVLTRYEKEEDLPRHDTIRQDLKSGEIVCTITAETPVFISNGKKQNDADFFKGANGKYMIPGSSLRGLVRTNMQILGCGVVTVGEDLEDYKIMFRSVGDKNDTEKDNAADKKVSVKKFYNSALGVITKKIPGSEQFASLPTKVKGGFICNEGNDQYMIYPNSEEESKSRGYYCIREDTIIRRMNTAKESGERNPYEFLIQVELIEYGCRMQHIGNFKIEYRKGIKHIIGDKNSFYSPFYTLVSFDKTEAGDILKIGKPHEYSSEGWVSCVGKMNEHKLIYIFPLINRGVEPITINDNDVLSFRKDYENKANQLGSNKNFWSLPDKGTSRPVFYCNHDGKLYFGYTPYLRIFYTNSIAQGLPESYITDEPVTLDYAHAVLGFTSKELSYRSRGSFGDFTLQNGENKTQTEIKLILGSPKPSSYLDYLYDGKSYLNDNFKLRGFKQYWMKDPRNIDIINDNKNNNIITYLHPMPKGTTFTGVIRYNNLTEDELGLLLWCLRLNPECSQTIGMGKPYGYGRIKILINSLRELDCGHLYKTDILAMQITAQKDADCSEIVAGYINNYKKYASSKLKAMNDTEQSDIDKRPNIRNFIFMHSEIRKPDEVRYMDLNKKEYQNRKALCTVDDIMPQTSDTEDESYQDTINKLLEMRGSKFKNNSDKKETNKKCRKK